MKFRFLPLILLMAVILISILPVRAQDDAYPRTIVDGAGRELNLEQRPERVVALYNDNFGMLATLNIRPVGVLANPEMLTDPIYFDGTGLDIPQISYSDSVNIEEIAALNPDLVMASNVEEAVAIEEIAPVYLPSSPKDLEQLYDQLRNVASIFALETEAEAAIEAFEARYTAYQTMSPGNVSVLKLGAMDDGAFYISTLDDPLCQILNTLARCDWEKPAPDEYWGYETTIEGVLALDPDIIILNNWSSLSREELLSALADNPLWNELSAVQNERVLGTADYENPIASSLPAAQKFLDTYMPLIYPEVFPTSLTDEQVQDILADEGETASPFPVTITDRLGRELTLATPAERIFCLSEPCLHTLAALDQLPAGAWPFFYQYVLSDPALFGERAAEIPILDGLESVDLEAIAALDPDLIVAWPGYETYLPDEFVNTVAPVFQAGYDLMAADLTSLGHDMRMIAAAVDKTDVAEDRLDRLEARQAAYLQVLGDTPRREVLVVRLESPDTNSIWALPCGPLMAQIVICANTVGDWFQYSPESLLAADPEVLIVEDWGENVGTFTPSSWSEADVPLWDEIPAVSEGRTFYIPVIATAPYSPIAWEQTLDTLMPLLYPDIFPTALTDEQVQDILAEAQ
jgi:iron complex transport system substrate-binding protein